MPLSSLKKQQKNRTKILECRRTLLSHPPKQIISSGQDAFTSLFGMGRGGTHLDKTPASQNFGAVFKYFRVEPRTGIKIYEICIS